ncbi:unnamed protein product, partial [Brenthis ino]
MILTRRPLPSLSSSLSKDDCLLPSIRAWISGLRGRAGYEDRRTIGAGLAPINTEKILGKSIIGGTFII